MKTVVTISKTLNSPITITISNNDIELQMGMDDFVKALKDDLGSVTWVFTQKEFEKRLDYSIGKILKQIKQESVKVV